MAVGTFFSVPDRFIGLPAAIAECDSGNLNDPQLRIPQHRVPHLEIIPAVRKQIGHDAGDLSDLQRHGSDSRDMLFFCRLLQCLGHMEDDSHFMHQTVTSFFCSSLCS